ncbi:hypothetical protein PHMEG_00036649 [Phytophthora megakarya]|uniref:Reverse transcriptase/retrotransposon-derived protein RNase H-like domain-containing protein n=1 Tax=Phytophthora megakarya TaxID=4795 RepID=A0A225ULK9_9STRA|nr:hypothetical protein PHMEG_00036649 [Phytophthora megakarya]
MTLDRLLARFTECRISISFTKSIFVQPRVEFLSHEVSHEGIRANTKRLAAITKLSFPRTKRGMQSFLGTLNYYSRFLQDFAVFGAALYQLKDDDFEEGGDLSTARRSFDMLKQKVAEAPILRHFDKTKEVHIMLFANEWALSTTLLQLHEDKLHPMRFCGRVLKDVEMNYHAAEKEVLALLLLLKTCYTQLAGRTLHSNGPCCCHLIVQRIKEKDCAFTRLLQSTVTSFVDIDDSLELIAPPQKGSPTARIDPQLLYAKLPFDYSGFVVSFDGSAKTEKNGGYGSCAWVVWRLPEWTIVLAASAYLESTTVNVAEYTGMNNGVRAALELGADNLVVVGDSRLAIQQSLGVIACRKETLMARLNHHKELTSKLKSVKEINAAADSLATEALESNTSKVVLDESRKLELAGLNRIREAIYDSSQTRIEVKPVAEDSTRGISTISASQSNPFAAFVQTTRRKSACYVSAVTRSQIITQKKRVHFADDSAATPETAMPKPMSTEDTENAAVIPEGNLAQCGSSCK